jgi:hypothetical protein
MGKIRKNETGFSAVEIVLVLVIVGLIGVVGYMVYKNQHKTTAPVATTISTKPASTTPAKTAPADPYAGWKQYCDTDHKTCFKYPADWAQNEDKVALSDTVNNVGSTVASPNKTVNISYDFPYIKDGGESNFLTMSIDDVPNYPDLKIVGGIYTDMNNFSEYAIVNSSVVSQYGLAVGKTTQFIVTPRFHASTDGDYQFVAIAAANGADHTLTAAKSEFSSQDAKTGVLILKSFSKQ